MTVSNGLGTLSRIGPYRNNSIKPAKVLISWLSSVGDPATLFPPSARGLAQQLVAPE